MASVAAMADRTDATVPNNKKNPGPIVQYLNRLNHTPPFDFIFYGIFWAFVCLVCSPICGCFLLVATGMKCVRYLLVLPFGMANGSRLNPNKDNVGARYAVLVTGCDSGFGCDLSFELATRGFTVFAGCRSDDAMRQFEGTDRLVAMKMDVTKDSEVSAAISIISKWLSDGNSEAPRYLRAVVNNAGIGTGAPVDWLDMSDYRRDMEVNYFGMIRVTKACLPILKSQSKHHAAARVVNIVSMAGLYATGGFSSYSGSKFAAEAFSSSLRHELSAFGVTVVTVNPSYHQTPLTSGMGQSLNRKWEELKPEVRQEYGEAFFLQLYQNLVHRVQSVMWEPSVVVKELVSCVELSRPCPQVVIGSDAKFSILLMRHMPIWLQDLVLYTFAISRKEKPAFVNNDGELRI